MHASGLIITSAVYYTCYQGVVEAARMGIPGGSYFDILMVTLASQTLASFTIYGWYLLLLVSFLQRTRVPTTLLILAFAGRGLKT